MEALLADSDASRKPPTNLNDTNYINAVQALIEALVASTADTTTVTKEWLSELVASTDPALGVEHVMKSIQEACALPDSIRQQEALVDVVGWDHWDVLQSILQHASQISKLDLTETSEITVMVDVEEERRQLILREAQEAAQLLAIMEAEMESAPFSSSSATHTLQRKSTQAQEKQLRKLQKRAQETKQRAIEEGAITEDLWAVSQDTLGPGGLAQSTRQDLKELQNSLMPEGSRAFHQSRGLPAGTIRESDDDWERVLIPPPSASATDLPRLSIQESVEPPMSRLFKGISTLNPMQSAVYPSAYQSLENLLVCAPTGAGKTNVALLAMAAHLKHTYWKRSSSLPPKMIYIAPMKALAQEVVEKMSARLAPLVVKELTGDMSLTRAQAAAAHLIVTTPEKWDVVTRKSTTDTTSLGSQCGLLILDEVHLLADPDRGGVLESIVSRTHRLVEATQRPIRLVGLSATLPNYQHVAQFMQAKVHYFGPEHRPVPLIQQFIGVAARNKFAREARLNQECFKVVKDSLERGYQVMVFVHSRKGTSDTAQELADSASQAEVLESLLVTAGKENEAGRAYAKFSDRVKKSPNRQVQHFFQNGLGIHHAGMLRGDRKLTEQLFAEGAIRVLCCTATLAWGINLPAHSVVIKGTDVYNPEQGRSTDLSILDVQQIFGRAGRPQFDTLGEATLITSMDAFGRYMNVLVRQVPMESNFGKQLADHLNAEIVSGTVATVQEAISWLKYTYLYTRMQHNPMAYGIKLTDRDADPTLQGPCHDLIHQAAKLLQEAQMIRYMDGNLSVADKGRVAAHFYIQAETIETFNDLLRMDYTTDADLCRVICHANEFRNLRVRQEEMDELERLVGSACPLPIKGAGLDDQGRGLITDCADKAFVLLQAFISRAKLNGFTLITDRNYLSSNASRVARAVFEICLKQRNALQALKMLRIAKSVDHEFWWFQTPLRHFGNELGENVYVAIEQKTNQTDPFDSLLSLLEMQPKEVEIFCKWNRQKGARGGEKIQRLIRTIPNVHLDCKAKPITSQTMLFNITVTPAFEWNPRWHGGALSFWLWVENGDRILHDESILLTKRTFPTALVLDVNLPLFDDHPSHYTVRVVSDSWVGMEVTLPVSLDHVGAVQDVSITTPLLDLTPLPVAALKNPRLEKMFRFSSFNPIQTQLFHVLYHTDLPVLLGAPTGSGKTVVAELAIFRMKNVDRKSIAVYIAPLKSLARERKNEWRQKPWKVLELSGDTHYDNKVMEEADVLICTPEKWDLISRGWRTARGFVQRAKLLILDEVHLLGEERGAVLEAIVSRTRFISKFLDPSADEEQTRIVGLSTALANPIDLADWIGIDTKGDNRMLGLYNFHPSLRQVPCEVHVQGYTGRHYCPRMATMNKPCFAAIKAHSPINPVLIFVASRRQTRLTAFDIISYVAAEDNPKRFLACSEDFVESLEVMDEALRHTLTFGIGLHHAGLAVSDRQLVEDLYVSGKIQVLVATSTLAWGVNTPARLVIVKGTEYFDGKSSRYVDYPLTDVLQMIGRAGRPGFDNVGVAVVMSTLEKKPFYHKFLYSPFPVESCLKGRMCENLNAEIVSGTITTVIETAGYLTWTFFARRVKTNPAFYGAPTGHEADPEAFLLGVAQETLGKLSEQGCIELEGDGINAKVHPLHLGEACSSFYLTYETPKQMQKSVRQSRDLLAELLSDVETNAKTSMVWRGPSGTINASAPSISERMDEVMLASILFSLAWTHEFDELPVRHNEDELNDKLSENVAWGTDINSLLGVGSFVDPETFSDPHTKCFLLLQAHIEGTKLPISDYVNDTKTVVENLPRLLGAMRFIAAKEPPISNSFNLLYQFARSKQFLETKTRVEDNPLVQLNGMSSKMALDLSKKQGVAVSTQKLRCLPRDEASQILRHVAPRRAGALKPWLKGVLDSLYDIPHIADVELSLARTMAKADSSPLGKLKVTLHFERDTPKKDSSYTLIILLGTDKGGQLLAESSVRATRGGKWTTTKELEFDWQKAVAVGDTESASIVLCLAWEECRGFDLQTSISLQQAAPYSV